MSDKFVLKIPPDLVALFNSRLYESCTDDAYMLEVDATLFCRLHKIFDCIPDSPIRRPTFIDLQGVK